MDPKKRIRATAGIHVVSEYSETRDRGRTESDKDQNDDEICGGAKMSDGM